MTPDNTKRAVRWTAAGLTVLAVTGATAAIGANPFPAPSQPSQVATRSYDASWSHDSHHEHEGIIEQVRGVVERILGDDDAAAAGVAPQASYVQSAPAASFGGVMNAIQGIADVPVWWLIARVSGIVGYLAIVASMVSGVALRTRLMQRVASPMARMEWHKVLGMLGLGLVALHGIALVMDNYITLTWLDLVVPGGSDYRPLWVSVGVISLWLMLIASAAAMLKKHLRAGVWEGIHLAGYGVFITATLHGLMAGTDSGQPWMLGIYVVSTALVAGVAARRLLAGPNAPLKKRRAPTPATAAEVGVSR